jgi:hypothetical protein
MLLRRRGCEAVSRAFQRSALKAGSSQAAQKTMPHVAAFVYRTTFEALGFI